jgi:protein TonB
MLTTLQAIKADRLIRPQMRTGAAVKRFIRLIGVCIALHVGLVAGAFLGEDFLTTSPLPPLVIPVDLVEEPPPQVKVEEKPDDEPKEQAQEKAAEPPPPAKEQQEPEKAETPPPPPVNLEPAMDFARVSEKEIENKTAGGPSVAEREEPAPVAQANPPKEIEQPKAEQKPAPEPLKPAPAQPPTPAAQAPDKAPPDSPPPEPEGLLAGAEASPLETPQPPEAAPEAAPAPESTQPENPIAKRFAFFEPVPKMEFDAGVKSSRNPGGTAAANYNSTLYGMIVPLIRFPPGAQQIPRRESAAVSFIVDGRGRLVQIGIVRASGVPSIDLAVVAAIRQAAPYPPPPNGLPLGLEMHY